jgi:phosphohistidine phosphatase
MKLYLIRHADALPLGDGIPDDAQRPLSVRGQEQCSRIAAALNRQGVVLQALLTSPLLRARQTAEGMNAHLSQPAPPLQDCDLLGPALKPRKVTNVVRAQTGDAIGLVGHMPDLAFYAAWLIGSKKAQIDLAKAGLARIDFEGKVGKGKGLLTWLITPEWFRAE